MASVPSHSFRRWLVAAALVLAVCTMIVGLRRCDNRGSAGATSRQGRIAEVGGTVGNAATTAPAAQPVGASVTETNLLPQMRAFSFVMDETTIRLGEAVTLAGRVKAPPRSIAPDRLEFVAYARSGNSVYEGSVDHPLHRTYEYEDPQNPGALRHAYRDLPAETFQIRLPSSVAATRIEFVEVRTRNGVESRRPVATMSLP